MQIVFIVISLWGWYAWLRGGKDATPLPISAIPLRLSLVLIVLTPIATVGATSFISAIQGSAPFWDTFTVVISLIATYVMGWRYIQNWLLWIAADLIYIPLLASQHLYLSSILYFLFLLMCLRGLALWQTELRAQKVVLS